MPTKVPNQANIWALKEMGCTHIIATSACGSLKKEIAPGHLILVDQFIDRTTQRKSTFYEKDRVCHIPMAEPFCPTLRKKLAATCRELELNFHEGGTVITIEGPRFSTKAESNLFRQWGADVINMSTVPEVVLAREAGLCYQVVGMSTDYDCWHESEESVSIDMVIATMKKNAENVKQLMIKTIPKITGAGCDCREYIKTAIM
jgi:5'-methylthioadenosine phosphorylase